MSDRVTRATVVGDGAMGTLCALMLAEQGARVRLWGAFPEHIAELTRDRENRRYLRGYPLGDRIVPVAEPAEAFDDPDLIISAVPCQYIRSVWERFAGLVGRTAPIVSVAKGIEVDTLLTPVGILRECVGDVALVCLSGPSIAPEVAAKKPTGVVAASEDELAANRTQDAFSRSYFRVYTSRDVVGVELAGASKNVIALAAGIADGIEAGVNAKASLLTRGLVEITRLGVAMGASPDTFRGLAGVGDLVTTCVSPVSRNRSAGERIGRGATTEQAIAATDSVIEGIATTRSVLALAHRHDVEMPIVSAVASVLFEGCRPADAIDQLMTRPLGAEATF